MQAAPPVPSSRSRIMIASSDASGAAFAHYLRDAGHDVVHAGAPEQLLRIALESAPDLCIVDQVLDGEHSLELAVEMHNETQIPFLFLSTPAPGSARNAARHGAASFLIKPVAPAQLLAAVESALVRSAELASLRAVTSRLQKTLHAGRDTSVATGVFMERYHMSQDQAFEALRRYARTHSRRIAEVANEVIHAQELLNTTAPRSAEK